MTALRGYRVLELAEGVSGEYCGKLLADLGADVIKIEKPGAGSPVRALSPRAHGASGLFAYLNTNKSSVALDLTDEDGAASLSRLVNQADAIIDDHAPGWLARTGLDPSDFEVQHPAAILCSITPYGQEPPEDRLHAEDLNIFHASGWGYHNPSGATESDPPLKAAGRFLVSYESGLEAALSVMAALFDRESSGQGRFIGISKQRVMAERTDYVLAQMVAGDMDVSTARTAFDLGGPSSIYPCLEGSVYFWISDAIQWEALRSLMNRPAWMEEFPEWWLERGTTPERVDKFRRELTAWLRTQDRNAVSVAAQKLSLMMVPLNTAPDLLASPQHAHRGYFTEFDQPGIGKMIVPTTPYRLSLTPARIERPAPALGEHTMAKLAAGGESSRMCSQAVSSWNKRPVLSDRGGPLAGVRVIELTKVWAGPFVGRLLAYLGAEVIRVESRESLDTARSYNVSDIDNAPGFQAVNPQKLSVQINMRHKDGIGLILDLLGKSDIFVENMRPGAIDRMGLGYEVAKAANPALVFVSIGMHGHEGPLAYQSGYAPCFAALSGVSSLVGYDDGPARGMNIRYGDSTVGTSAAFAAVAALLHSRRTGLGQFVDVSAVEALASMIADTVVDYTLTGNVPRHDANRHADMAPHGTYPCKGGEWISIAVPSDSAWAALAAAMGQPELSQDTRFASLAQRKANEEALNLRVASWTAGEDASKLAAALQRRGIAAAKSLNSIELVADPHLWAGDFFPVVTDRAGGSRPVVGSAWTMSRGAAIRDRGPGLGEHNDYVLGDILGLSAERQRQLTESGVVR